MLLFKFTLRGIQLTLVLGEQDFNLKQVIFFLMYGVSLNYHMGALFDKMNFLIFLSNMSWISFFL